MNRFRRCLALSFVLLFALSAFAQLDPALFSGLEWRLLGPFRGGRSLAAVGVPGQPGVYYMGSVGGGVWKSTDAGTTWQPIFDSQRIASIGAIALAPSDPNIVYVGTGEADMRSQISYGNGVYKSTDAGKSWTHLGLDDTQQIGRVLVHPKNPDIVYVAALGHAYGPNAERGVFRTRDGGKTWRKVLYKDPDTGAIDMAFDPSNPDVIYASLWQTRRPPWNVYPPSNGPGSALFKSADGGDTWQPVTGLPAEGLGRIGIAVAPSLPSRVYLVLDARQGGVYRSDDAGKTWTRLASENRLWGRGWYFCHITVDPNNPDIVYVNNTSLYRSSDGGRNFVAIKGAPGGDDYHGIWIAPEDSNRWIVAADQGVIVTLNGGKTWSSWYNQPIGQFYRVATDNRFPYWVYGAQQDSGAYAVPSRTHYASLNDHDWRPIAVGGENGSIAPDPLHPGIILGGVLTRYDWNSAQEQSVSPTLTRLGPWRRTWTLPLEFSPKDPRKLYASHQQLFRSIDGGQTWQAISSDLTREDPGIPPNLDPVTAKDVSIGGPRRGVIYSLGPSPLDANLLWAGTDDGLIHLTRDDGKTWQNVTPAGLTAWSKVAIIEPSHFDANTAFAAVDRHRLEDYRAHIYRTRDGGRSWQDVGASLPREASFVNVVREDPQRQGLLYAGTELGFWVSFDDGGHWQPLQLNLPAVSVRDIEVHGDDLVIATHGRAFWVLDDATPLRQVSAAMLQQPAALFKPQAAVRVRPGSDEGTPLPPETPKAPNAPTGAILNYWLNHDTGQPVVIEILDSAGKLVRRYASDEAPRPVEERTLDYPLYWVRPAQPPATTRGMHRFLWDMHYAALASPEGGRAGRRAAQGPWAPPGNYSVRLTVEGRQYTQPLTLNPDPRVNTSPADFQRQFQVSMQLQDLMARSGRAARQAEALQRGAAQVKQKAGGAAAAALDAFIQKIDAAAGPPVANPFAGEPERGEPERISIRVLSRMFTQLYGAVQSADAAPTPEVAAAASEFGQKLEPLLQQWTVLVGSDLPRLNEQLRAAGLPPVSDAR